MSSTDTYIYNVFFTHRDDSTVEVTIPDLKLSIVGRSETDAWKRGRRLVGSRLCELDARNEKIPAPTPLEQFSLQPNQSLVSMDIFMPAYQRREDIMEA